MKELTEIDPQGATLGQDFSKNVSKTPGTLSVVKAIGAQLLSLCLLTACPSKQTEMPDLNLVSYDLPKKLHLRKQVEIPNDISNLVDQINNKQPVSFNFITDLKFRQETEAYFEENNNEIKIGERESDLEVRKNLFHHHGQLTTKELNTKSLPFKTLGTQKVKYENHLVQKVYPRGLAGSEAPDRIRYNKNATTIFDILLNGRLQCYSGSNLNLLINRQRLVGQAYHQEHFVVIMTPGHVLVGEMFKKNDEWILRATETTASDEGLEEIPAKEISDRVHVYMATEYFLIDVLKNYLEFSTRDLIWSLRQRTAERYGIPIPTTQLAAIQGQGQIEIESSNPSPLSGSQSERAHNWSPFGFGSVDVPEGDIERTPTSGIGALRSLSAQSAQGHFGQSPELLKQPSEPWKFSYDEYRSQQMFYAEKGARLVIQDRGLVELTPEALVMKTILQKISAAIREAMTPEIHAQIEAEYVKTLNREDFESSAFATDFFPESFWAGLEKDLFSLSRERIPVSSLYSFFHSRLGFLLTCGPDLLLLDDLNHRPRAVTSSGPTKLNLMHLLPQAARMSFDPGSCFALGQILTHITLPGSDDKMEAISWLLRKRLNPFNTSETEEDYFSSNPALIKMYNSPLNVDHENQSKLSFVIKPSDVFSDATQPNDFEKNQIDVLHQRLLNDSWRMTHERGLRYLYREQTRLREQAAENEETKEEIEKTLPEEEKNDDAFKPDRA